MTNNIEKFKKQLAIVFDDSLHTRIWHNMVDWFIIGLIIMSAIELFLATFKGLGSEVETALSFINHFTTIFFTIEVTLRIWTADLLSPKYRGWKGRLRYCFSFYGFIDILSTYPILLAYCIPLHTTVFKIETSAKTSCFIQSQLFHCLFW